LNLTGPPSPTSPVDHPGDAEKRLRCVRGLGEDCVGHIAAPQSVVAQFGVLICNAGRSRGRASAGEQDLRHGLNVRDVEFSELADVVEDFVELPAIELHFLGCQLEVREFSDPQYFFTCNFHARPSYGQEVNVSRGSGMVAGSAAQLDCGAATVW